MDKKKQHDMEQNELTKKLEELYGIDVGDSLQSVTYAPTENNYLNEHVQEANEDN